MRVLFFVEPLVEREDPLWKKGWLDHFVREIAQSLIKEGVGPAELSVICPAALGGLARQVLPEARIGMIDQPELVPKFGHSSLDIATQWYNGSATPALMDEMARLVKGKVDPFVPDLCITFSPAPFIKLAWPNSKVIHFECGFISRPPFPETVYFDPEGMFRSGSLIRHRERIRNYTPSDDEFGLVSQIRADFCASADPSDNPLAEIVQSALAPFESAILLALQFSNFYAYDANARFSDQYDLLVNTLESVPKNVAVVVCEHPEHLVLKDESIAFLRRQYPNFVWHPLFRAVYGASHYLMPFVQAVVTVSSSVGLQTLLWKKHLVVVGSSHLDLVCDAHEVSELTAKLGGEWPAWKEASLAWLLSRFYLPLNSLLESNMLRAFLTDIASGAFEGLQDAGSNCGLNPTTLKAAYRSAKLKQSVTPFGVSLSPGSKQFFAAIYVATEAKEFDETTCIRRFVDFSTKHHAILEFPLRGVNEKPIGLRFDPCNISCCKIVTDFVVVDGRGEVIWQWDGTYAGIVSYVGLMIFPVRESSAALLISETSDPQIEFLIDYAAFRAAFGPITVRVSMRLVEQGEFDQLVRGRDAENALLRSDLADHIDQHSSLGQGVVERDEAIAKLTADIAAYEGQITNLNQAVVERDGHIASLHHGIVGRDGQMTSLSQAVAERDARIAELDRGIAARDGQITCLNQAIAERDEQIACRNQEWEKRLVEHQCHVAELEMAVSAEQRRFSIQLAEMRDLRQQFDNVLSSRAWRLTGPIRTMLTYTYAVPTKISGQALTTYRALRFRPAQKQKLKNFLFSAFGFAFKRMDAYKRWQEYRQIQTDWPSVTPVAVEPSSPSRVFGPLPLLQKADGIWEWSDYDAVKSRISQTRAQQLSQVNPLPFEMIDIGSEPFESVAAKVALPVAPAEPDVSIILPVFNNLKLTLECLLSISAHSSARLSFEIILADDASTDQTQQVVSKIANLRVVRNVQNLGFLRNCNNALEHARGRYLVYLNNDVQVTRDWLENLYQTFDAYPNVGAVGPRFVYPSGHLQEAGAAFRHDGTADMVGLNDDPDKPRYGYTRRVDYVSGASLMMPTALARQLGGFSEEFLPCYCEDSDLCLRVIDVGYDVYFNPGSVIIHHLSKTTAAFDSDFKLRSIATNLVKLGQKWQGYFDRVSNPRIIAFYLPQFHPFPENDRWWGNGFTEWTNVTKAQPNFVGHDQPRLPADLGFYDLRLREIQQQQADLAQRYGIHGFCYYYYWFGGKRLLEQPIEQMLASGKPDMPFCLCWANENWTRRWDGQDQEILMAQSHSPEDDEAVINDLIRYFRDPRYIRIDGRPIILVYRVSLFPDFSATVACWREVCQRQGIGEIYVAMVESMELTHSNKHPRDFGCDAAVEFPPQGMAEQTAPSGEVINPEFAGAVADYRDIAVRYATRDFPGYTRFKGVMPGWDNTARRQNNSFCFEHATPGTFQAWLEDSIEQTRQQHYGDEKLVFVNAWNEWAEGAYLEPDRRFGHSYLEAVKNATESTRLLCRNKYWHGS